jgi:hypothetical protein
MSRPRRHSATRAGPINRSVDDIPFNPSAGPVSRGSDFPSRGSESHNQGKTSCSRSFVQTPLTPLPDGLARAHPLAKSGTFRHFLALFGGGHWRRSLLSKATYDKSPPCSVPFFGTRPFFVVMVLYSDHARAFESGPILHENRWGRSKIARAWRSDAVHEIGGSHEAAKTQRREGANTGCAHRLAAIDRRTGQVTLTFASPTNEFSCVNLLRVLA